MSDGPDEREADLDSHPLSGVLDRLIRRERGVPAVEPKASAGPSPAPEPSRRRVVVVAGLGHDRGAAAVVHLARSGVGRDLRVAVVDLAAEPIPASGENPVASVPIASLPHGIEGLRLEPAETVRAVLERLRRLEAGCDLLVVRIPASAGHVLARAAFLAGGVVLPIGQGDKALHEALWLSRNLLDSLPGIALVPYSADEAALGRYAEILRAFDEAGSSSPEADDLEGLDAIAPLAGGTGEGFLASLVGESLSGEPQTVLEVGRLSI